MPRFTIPADFKGSTIEALSRKNDDWEFPVKEVYGSLRPSPFGAGRKGSDLRPIGFDLLKSYVRTCRDHGIAFNYTLNLSCHSNREFTAKGIQEIVAFVKKLGSIGIHHYTVAMPSVIDILNKHVPEAKVGVSVISTIDSPFRLRSFVSTANIDRVIFPAFMNRNLEGIDRMIACKQELGIEFGTIVNSLCFIDCPFRAFHYSSGSHNKKTGMEDYYFARCYTMKLQDPVQILKAPWIRPEDIRSYARRGIDSFKISGREFWNADFPRVVDIYNQGSFDGNLMDVLTGFEGMGKVFNMPNRPLDRFTRPFLEGKLSCTGKECDTCNYCPSQARLIQVDHEKSQPSVRYFEAQLDALSNGRRNAPALARRIVSRSRRTLSKLRGAGA